MKSHSLTITAIAAAVAAAYVLVVRPWYLRWGASEDEVRKPLPGDELVPQPKIQSTRAITIEAPVEDVWPWLVQLGYGRGGFYSYDLLENAFTRGLGMHAHYESLDRLVPALQDLHEGDFVASAPLDWKDGKYADKMGWTVVRLEPPRLMVLKNWGAFILEPLDGGRTRFIVRTRGGRTWKDVAANVAWELPHFIMERGMLLGIKQRAERIKGAGRTQERNGVRVT